ncbi:MAG: YXWGXW repeat-containing protein [Planctomycetales bacterium]|nr:YXWGXW repeat-containing protein [Planctomycetales bacterium]
MRSALRTLTTVVIVLSSCLLSSFASADNGIDTQTNIEVLLRGPIHEAFATSATVDPVDSPLITREPPEPIDELLPDHRPVGARVIWIPGYWAFDHLDDDFIWISGVWRNAPPGRQWVPGYWEQVDGGYRWMPGAWVEAGSRVTYQSKPPTSQERGPASPRPSNNHFYVQGCWVQQGGNYKWRPGYWVPQQQDWVWVPARYTLAADGYLYSDGYWDYRLDERGRVFAPVRLNSNTRAAVRVSYTPTIVLDNNTQLMLHLFAAPAQGRYYFGDYYADQYAAAGIRPWFDDDGIGFDPLLSHYVWRYGDSYLNNLQGWNKYFIGHPEYRPRTTFDAQLQFVENNADFEHLDRVLLGDSLENVVSSTSDVGHLVSLSSADRELFGNIAQQLNDITRQRVDLAADVSATVGVATREVLKLPELPSDVAPQLERTLPANPLQLRNVVPKLPLPTGRARLPIGLPRLPF